MRGTRSSNLTLPAAQVGAVEFRDIDARSHDARYLVDEAEVADAFSDDRTSEPIGLGRPNLRFGITRDQIYGRVTLGLARVREVQNRRVMFDDRYIAPTLDSAAAPRLRGGLADIVGRAGQRAEELALRAVEATDGGSDTFASFLLLQALNAGCRCWNICNSCLSSIPSACSRRSFRWRARSRR